MNCPACDHVNAEGARYCAKCGALLPVAHMDGADPMIGTVVGGRYRITSLLGEGGMGRVYIGEQQMGTAVRKVAVKTLLQEFSKDPQVVARFMRECGTVVELEHPNTIKFYDFGQTDTGDLYIAMEYVNGRPLSEVIETEGAMSFDRVDKIMKQICGSLHEAHEKGIVHRDLKPENVILTKRAGEDDFVKVLDFGIAKRNEASDTAAEQKLTQAGMVLGTPPYMSPEQFTGKELGRRSDIYSLGVMAYEMLTGQLPFKANTPWEWATQHMTQQPSPFEKTGPMAAQIPVHIKSACMTALSKEPDKRHDTALAFFKDLHGDGAAPAAVPVAAAATPAATEAFTAPTAAPQTAPSAGARKGTGTQIGEPFVPPPGAMGGPVGATAPGTGPMVAHQNVPTAGGQAIPAAPQPYQPSGGGGGGGGGGKGAMIGLAILLAGGLAAGAFFMLKGDDAESDPPIVDLDETTSDTKSGASEDDRSSAGEGEGEGEGEGGSTPDPEPTPDPDASTPDPTPDPTPSPTPQPPKPPAPPTGDPQACSKASSAAMSKNCSAAASHLSKCTGSGRTMAQAHYNNNCASRPPPTPTPTPPPTKKRRRRRRVIIPPR